MEKNTLYKEFGLTFLLGGCIFLFFGWLYPFHLVYQEQYQLFLFTSDYLAETVGRPGGMVNYLGRFITQFFYFPWIGAALVALLLVFLQREMAGIMKRFRNSSVCLPLSCIPSLFYWVLLCDENMMPGGIFALLLVLAGALVYFSLPSVKVRGIYGVVMIPALYWFTGGAFLIFVGLSLCWEIQVKKESGKWVWSMLAAFLLISLLLPLAAKLWLVQYPLSKLWTGAEYYRFRHIFPNVIPLVWMMVVLIPVVSRYLPEKSAKQGGVWFTGLVVLLFGCTGYLVYTNADFRKEEVMRYDYYARHRQWSKIIAYADQKTPDAPLSVACLNLALAKEGILGERMFSYFQNGPEGLMPSFLIDFTVPMTTNEIYYHLGFINISKRFVFEAMESIPDFQKSARAVKRLAEANLIMGEYAVAAKYLKILQQTWVYRKWATHALTVLGDDERIEAHPEWGMLRKYRLQQDFLFSEQEKDMMLGLLLQQDYTNRMAFDYLMAYTLLTKNLPHFQPYFRLGEPLTLQGIPKAYQEALIYIWGLTNNDPSRSIPYPISSTVKSRVEAYRKIYTTYPNPEPMLKSQFSDTYWYYYHFRK
ncbi:MAG: DUF6057 family protein [Tannerellaceae bacterium]|nr:DUF6057 family protein [Tannerellaceae bacterium]